MKNKLGLLALLCASFLTGVSYADPPAIEKKASVVTTQSKGATNITIMPNLGYKWNAQYPAVLKFSICSDLECGVYTEKILIKK